jgi:alpha-amylase
MNVLSDFIDRVERQFPASIENEELNALLTTIINQEEEIKKLKKEVETAKIKAVTKKSRVVVNETTLHNV